jgi:hypothetical protein
VLPEAGVTYYDVPPEYSVREYRYTVVNETPVLVEPRTRRVIEVIASKGLGHYVCGHGPAYASQEPITIEYERPDGGRGF